MVYCYVMVTVAPMVPLNEAYTTFASCRRCILLSDSMIHVRCTYDNNVTGKTAMHKV